MTILRRAALALMLALPAQLLAQSMTFSFPNSASSSGTVSSVGVTTANGVSGTVANPTTTPAISLTLGNITPSSVASTGTISGTTESLTSGSSAWSATQPGGGSAGGLNFPNSVNSTGNAITFGGFSSGGAVAGLFEVSNSSVGSSMYVATTDSFATGPQTAISISPAGNILFNRGNLTIGSAIVFNAAGALQAAAFPALAGDVTTSAGSLTTAVAANAITFPKFQQVAASSIVGNPTGSLANAQGITLSADLAFSASALQVGAFTGDITKSAGSLATAIGTNAVTFAKFQQVAASSLVGNPTGSLANAQGITLAGGLAFSGTTLTAAGALTPTSIASTGTVTTSAATSGIGYATGAGGTATQATSRTTGVTINKSCGAVTLVSAAGSATWNTFTVTDSAVGATDVVILSEKSGTDKYNMFVSAVAAGSFNISFSDVTGTTTEQPVINFCDIKGVAA